MKNTLLICAAAAASTLSSYAVSVYSEDFDSFALTSSSSGVHEFGGPMADAEVTYGQFFSSSDGVSASGTTLVFASGDQNKTRGAGVWLDASGWDDGLVTVTFDVTDFTAAVGLGSEAYIQTYTASGVNGTDAVGVDIHRGFNAGVGLSGAATSSTLGAATTITAAGTITHTFTYAGEEEIGLFFVNKAKNGIGDPSYQNATFTVDDLTVDATSNRPAKPNIVFILADDLGWQDLKSYDIATIDATQSVYQTPYTDQLAYEGVLFWQGYSPAPTCAPSRGAIMAGKHPARIQRHHVHGGTATKPYRDSNRMMVPYYSGRLPIAETTIPEALDPLGYYSGHSGKWHIAISHNAYPQPLDHGFDWTRADRGVQNSMADRNAGFATSDPSDDYQLDANGFAHDVTTQDALDFLIDAVTGATNPATANQPFFLYHASWLVHAPIHMRTESLLIKYAELMGQDFAPVDPNETWDDIGQNNPYYAAMVETFDYNVQQIVSYLESTDDPRWPGHKLIDNTYIFITSDNGGKEYIGENVTENWPLEGGKANIEEGGTRVPFIVVGPGIPADVESDVMVNGLDLFPTFVKLAGGTPTGTLDGCDLSDLLHSDPTDPLLVKDLSGTVRDTMYWHFPSIGKYGSTIRKDGWKFFQHYDYVNNAEQDQYRLYELYDSAGAPNDIGEETNVYDTDMSGIKATLVSELNTWLTEVDGGVARYNPNYKGSPSLPNQADVPVVIDNGDGSGIAWVTYETDKAQVVEADLLYTLNSGAQYEEWFKAPATITTLGRVEATVPDGTTHYVFNLIDENNFLVSSVEMGYEDDDVLDSTRATAYVYRYLYIGPEIELYDFDFTSETISDISFLERDSAGFHKRSDSAWTIVGGVLSNSSTVDSRVSEGAVAQIFDISSITDTGYDEITVSFDYTIAEATESLYLHLWGYEEIIPVPISVATTEIMNFGSTNGNAWERTYNDVPLPLTAYNLGKSDGVFTGTPGQADDAAAVITGEAGTFTYTETFKLSDFAPAAAPANLSLYDYLLVGFSRKIAGTAPAVTIDNLKIIVPNRDGYVVWAYEEGLVDDLVDSDPDFDGLNNLLEYGLGGNPAMADLDILPGFEVNTEETDEWIFRYRRRLDATAEEMTYRPECKKDLGDNLEVWTTTGITEVSAVAIDANYELVTCAVDVPGATSIFIRLAVAQAP